MIGVRIAAILCGLALAGCDAAAPEIAKCEAILMPQLKAPSTYKLVRSDIDPPDGAGVKNVFLKYDAANSYNAPIRGRFWCKVDKAGIATEGVPDVEAEMENLARAADAAVAKSRGTESRIPDAGSEVEEDTPVCDRPDSAEKKRLMNEIGVDCTGE